MGTGILSAVFGVIGTELFLALCGTAVTVGFLVCVFLAAFRRGYGFHKRFWYIILVALTVSVAKLRANVLGESDYSPLFTFFGLLLYLPLFFIPERQKTDEKEDDRRRELVKFIDRSVHIPVSPKIDEEIKAEPIKAVLKTEHLGCDLDFSHVKNVLKRLELASLSTSDRKQIHELELALFEAERGEDSQVVKSKVNEGLGNLLKIMAKHGV